MREDELLAISKNRKQKSKVLMITGDGWIITSNGAMGDFEEDCTIVWGQEDYLKSLRKSKRLTQQEMSWILGVSRPTYSLYESGKVEISHKQYLLTKLIGELPSQH